MLDHAGRRDKRVTIEAATDAVDSGGFPIETFTALDPPAWMSKKDLSSGSETFDANQVLARVDTEWQLLYRADMDPDRVDVPKTRRLVYQGRQYDITHAALMERSEGRGILLRTFSKLGGA